MDAVCADLLAEVRAFRQQHPEVRYVDLISLDIPGHFYGKRYPIDMLEKVAAGSALKLPQNCVLLGVQGGLFKIGDYCFNDGDPDAVRRLVSGTLKPVTWEAQPLGQMLITSDGTEKPIEFEPREVLAQVLDRLARKGIHPVVAFELEFYLFDKKLRDGLPQFPRDDLTDDASDVAGLPFMDMLYRFSKAGGYSLMQVTPGTASETLPKAHSKARAPTTPSYSAADLVAAIRTRQTLDRGYGGSPPCRPPPRDVP